MKMSLTKPRLPRVPRVYVNARDPDTGKSVADTFYFVTPIELIDKLRREALENDRAERNDSTTK